MKFNINKLPMKGKDIEELKTFIYEGRDILTDENYLKENIQFLLHRQLKKSLDIMQDGSHKI